jgi:predicted lipoprotein with Yx(FWY)xxD motif
MAGLSNSIRGVMAFTAALAIAACGAQGPLAEPSPTAAPAIATPTPAQMATATASPLPEAAPPAAPTPALASPTVAAQASPAGATLEIATSPEHGDYLAVDGRALYVFTPDPSGSSSCFDECADNWPPLAAPVTAGAGVDGMIGEFERSDDWGRQVTYNGAPLYFFIADAAPGEINGEGVGDAWFLARPSPTDEDEPALDYEY